MDEATPKSSDAFKHTSPTRRFMDLRRSLIEIHHTIHTPRLTIDIDSPHHHAHHHGFWHALTDRTSKPATRRVKHFGDRVFGRANAGGVGCYSRLLRMLGNLLAIIGIVSVIILYGASIFFSGGVSLLAWPLIVAAVGVLLNTVGVLIGWSVNTLKIEQLYDYQLELLYDSNKLRGKIKDRGKEDREGAEGSTANNSKQTCSPFLTEQTIPHGIFAHRRPNSSLFWVLVGRALHDTNGCCGTVIGWVTGILAFIPEIIISLLDVATLFLFSRVSALLSAGFAWVTNHTRLNENERVILRLQEEHFKLAKAFDEEGFFVQVDSMVSGAFNALDVQTEDKYYKWVRFTVMKELLDNKNLVEGLHDEVIKNILVEILKSCMNEKKCFSRSKLRNIGIRWHEAHPDTPIPNIHHHRGELAVLDAMPVLGAITYTKLAEASDKNKADFAEKKALQLLQGSSAFDRASDSFHDAWCQSLVYYLKKAMLDQRFSSDTTSLPQKERSGALSIMLNSFFSNGKLNLKKLREEFPCSLPSPHEARLFLAHKDAENVAQRVVLA